VEVHVVTGFSFEHVGFLMPIIVVPERLTQPSAGTGTVRLKLKSPRRMCEIKD
jgi:hypothetical protein